MFPKKTNKNDRKEKEKTKRDDKYEVSSWHRTLRTPQANMPEAC